MKHLQYLSYVLRHKWFVFLESCKLGIPWQGITHDMSKLLPSEWMPYANFFYGNKVQPIRDSTGYYKPTDTGDAAFDFAWLLHQKRNKHHWQWWCLPEDEAGLKTLPIPERFLREMLADWQGAGRAQRRPDTLAWYSKNGHKIQMEAKSRAWLESRIVNKTEDEQ